MSSALALQVVALGLLVAWSTDPLLVKASWTSRHPRIARRLWSASAASQAGCLIALALLLAHDVWEHSLLWATGAPKGDLHVAYAGGRDVSTSWNLAVVVAAVAVAAPLWHWATRRRAAERRRQAHQILPGQRHQYGGAILLLLPTPGSVLYCLPGRRLLRPRPPMVIASEDAWARLTPSERRAAMAHELAHLRLAHHRSVAVANAVADTARRVGLLRHYASEVRRLVELEADDAAGSIHGRRTVASALLKLSSAPSAWPPDAALPLGGQDVTSRVLRLLEPVVRDGLPLRVASRAAAACLIGTPYALLGAPLVFLA